MSKKILIGLLVAVFTLTLLVSAGVFAQERDATLEVLYEEIYELRRQIVERRVELGDLTAEEGKRRLELMEERYLRILEEGPGRFSGIPGKMRNNVEGRGYGPCWR